jgi:peptidoglycan/LPS O-acetylase OafA/YrhL
MKYASIGYLRAFVTLLVLAHHAVLAYHPFAPPMTASLAAEPRWWLAFPIVDPNRSVAALLLAAFNDIFFMALMFLLSGLFVWGSLRRKGAAAFLRDRAIRLGLPFIVATVLLAPLAYYPAYLQRTADPSIADFLRQWRSLGVWPAGPAWFIWMLLAFDAIAAGLFSLFAARRTHASASSDERDAPIDSRTLPSVLARPARFFFALVALSIVVYVPLALVYGPLAWLAWGPFTFQSSRLLLYALYFAAGIALGAYGIDRGMLVAGGALARRWWLWTIGALLVFILLSAWTVSGLSLAGTQATYIIVGNVGFAVSCAASSFALMAIFQRFATGKSRAWDSLTDNAYGLYLVHYVFVSWLQFGLLPWTTSGAAKGAAVFIGTLALSWAFVALTRRLPAVARVV